MFFCLFLFGKLTPLENSLLLEGDINKGISLLDSVESPTDYLLSHTLKKYFINEEFINHDHSSIVDLICSNSLKLVYANTVLNTNLMYDTPENICKYLLVVGNKISKEYLKCGYSFRPKVKYSNIISSEDKHLLTMVRSLDKSSINLYFAHLDSKKYYLGDQISLLEYLANKQVGRAYGYLGEAYFYGVGVVKSEDRALDYFLMGKDKNDSISNNGIGKILMSKEYEDYTGAKEHFDMTSGINETDYYLYLLYRDHFKIKQYAAYYLTRSTSLGYLPAIFKDGENYFKKGDYESALVRLGAIMDYDSTVIEYQDEAYKKYKEGKYGSALLYLLMTIEMGSDASLENALYILETKKISNINILILDKLYYTLLLKQNTQLNKIGDCYFYGRGICKSYKDAFSYYMAASTKGTEGKINLFFMYDKGLGVPRNLRKAWDTLRSIRVDDHNYLLVMYIYIIFVSKVVFNGYVLATLASGVLAYKMMRKM